MRVRWLVIVGFFALALGAHRFGLFASIRPCLSAALIGSVVNAANQWCVARWRWVLPITILALLDDLLLITYVSLATGGVNSPFISIYVVQVLATAMLVDTRVAAATAVLAVVLFGAGLAVETQNVYPGAGLVMTQTGGPARAILVYRAAWSAFLLYALSLLVYLGGYISRRMRLSQLDLAVKNHELEGAVDPLAAAKREIAAAYEQLKQTEVRLIQSEKMPALGQLVAGVPHELNDPISFVSANMELLRVYLRRLETLLACYETLDLDAADRSLIEREKQELQITNVLADLPGLLRDCEEGAQSTKHIVSELRTFSRSDELDRWRRVDVRDSITTTLPLLRHRLTKGDTRSPRARRFAPDRVRPRSHQSGAYESAR